MRPAVVNVASSVDLTKRKSELVTMQDRHLNAYLAGTVDEVLHKSKSNELRFEAATVEENFAALGDFDLAREQTALAIFDFLQNAAERWRGSNHHVRREILDLVCLNRRLSDVNLDTIKRNRFDVFAEGLVLKNSRGDRTPLELLTLIWSRGIGICGVRSPLLLTHSPFNSFYAFPRRQCAGQTGASRPANLLGRTT